MSAGKMVVALCPVYNVAPRYTHLLQECVYWFTRQTYAQRHLIILNDTPGQALICDTPNVTVLNVGAKIPTLGAKYNQMIRYAVEHLNATYVMPWEFDDICLPERITQSVELIRDYEYFNPKGSWWEDNGKLKPVYGNSVHQNASMWRTGTIDVPEVSGEQDALFDMAMRMRGRVCPVQLSQAHQWQYVYRWGVQHYHLSGFRNMQAAYSAPQTIVPGIFYIVPTMGRDYATACKEESERCV